KCESQGWDLASDADRSERTQGFAKLCAMVARTPAVERVVSMARTIPSETTAARQAHERTVKEREVEDEWGQDVMASRSEEHTSELQSRFDLVCRLLLE